MAAAKTNGNVSIFKDKPKIRRKGIHCKCKSSNSKNAKNYKKSYNGQG